MNKYSESYDFFLIISWESTASKVRQTFLVTENRRGTSPFLMPDFAIEYIFLHNAIQIFF